MNDKLERNPRARNISSYLAIVLFFSIGVISAMDRSPEWTEKDFEALRRKLQQEELREKYARIKAAERLEVQRVVKEVEEREKRRAQNHLQ